MSPFKFLKILGVISILSLGIWYFFIKNYDYKITFKTPQSKGIIYNYILGWNNWETSKNSVVGTYGKEPFLKLSQELHVSDSIIDIDWEIVKVSDSVTKVTAYVTDKNNSLIQKLKVPFVNTAFVNRMVSTVKKIQKELKELGDAHRVGTVEISKIPEQYCACIGLESTLSEKANKMIEMNADILIYLEENNIDIIGSPLLEVDKWDELHNTIAFNFCFPVAFNQNYKESEAVKFKMIEEKPALKTIFNGNYRISDCAWFSIIDYAEKKAIEIERLPVEVFLNDPHSGGNELEWKAEIYIPIKNN